MSIDHSTKRRDEDEDSETPPPPDGGWGWMVVFGSFMIHVVTDGVTYCFGIFYDEFLDYFQEGKGLTSWILSILVGVTLCSGPLSSYFVNRYGCRTVTIAGSLLASACLVSSFYAKNVLTLCLTVGIGTGTGFGLIYLPAIVSVTTYFEKKRSLATGIAVCGSGFGTFLFAPIISKLLEAYGWRGSILIIGGIILECILFGALFRPLEEINGEKGKKLKLTEAKVDLHISEHDLPQLTTSLPPQNGQYGGSGTMNGNGNGNMHRPHSVAHFTMSKNTKHELNGNIPSSGKYLQNDITRLALSQPMLTQSENRYRQHYHFGSQNWRKHGPLDRPDIFYQGSLMNIPSYRSKLSLRRGDEGEFMERPPSTTYSKRHETESRKLCGCLPCSDEVREMLDCALLRDVIFLIFSLSNLLTSIGFNVPYVYLVPKAKDLGMTKEKAGMLISVIGGANTVGRIVLGYISDKPWINRLYIYNWSLTICGVATFTSAFCSSFYTLAIYSAVFGFTAGAYVGLTSVILVDLLGLESLTNAFGLLLLFQGIASLIGPPIAGSLYDVTGSYNPGFILAGTAIGLSGIILFTIPPIQRWQAKRRQSKQISISL
ncbi:monocarboxylate transporter 5 isoform X2 [Diabrotica virgifera virgifera]|uniref:Major facilitator superfamily (MFS) profile domain-containing protein n=1 Tax=Diabrotica virgifera virgifera TaxID=50390 RepID=A0ABM5JYB8_DIAVI|nr:monocarboxylate transporter 5 isoform X2 [Diabrotica virgifera virgifera]